MPPPPQLSEPYKLLLVGGGKAHVMTLRRWKERATPASSPSSSSSSSLSSPSSSSSPSSAPPRLALVSESPTSCYSGMLPGVISGAYSPEQALLPLEPLCAAAGFDFIVGKVRRVSSERKEVELEVADDEGGGGKSVLRLGYETLSLDVGSTAKGEFDEAKASDRSVAVKPVGSLLERLRPLFDACEAASSPSSSSPLPSVVVVGGGAAGVEIAAAVAARLERAKEKRKEKEKEKEMEKEKEKDNESGPPHVSLVTGPRGLLPDESRPAAALVARELRGAGVRVVSGARVVSTPASVFSAEGAAREEEEEEEGEGGGRRGVVVAVEVGDGDGDGGGGASSSASFPPPLLLQLPADFVLWCTGSRPHPWLRDRTDLDLDDEGSVRVDPSLRCFRRRRPRGASGDDGAQTPLPPPLPSAFAAGDCASIVASLEDPKPSSSPPKSGVYAVRAGEQVLLPNLRAAVEGEGGGGGGGGRRDERRRCGGGGPAPPLPPLRQWSPSRQGRPALSLLSMGNGRAVALWPWRWVPAVAGRWVWLLKDFIDRRWIGR